MRRSPPALTATCSISSSCRRRHGQVDRIAFGDTAQVQAQWLRNRTPLPSTSSISRQPAESCHWHVAARQVTRGFKMPRDAGVECAVAQARDMQRRLENAVSVCINSLHLPVRVAVDPRQFAAGIVTAHQARGFARLPRSRHRWRNAELGWAVRARRRSRRGCRAAAARGAAYARHALPQRPAMAMA